MKSADSVRAQLMRGDAEVEKPVELAKLRVRLLPGRLLPGRSASAREKMQPQHCVPAELGTLDLVRWASSRPGNGTTGRRARCGAGSGTARYTTDGTPQQRR